MAIEYCVVCEEPTGRAGRDEDSLYDGNGHGPFCEHCFEKYTAKDAEIAALKQERDRLMCLLNDAREQQFASTTRAWHAEDKISELTAKRDALLKVREAADALADAIKVVPASMSEVSGVVQEVWQRYKVKSDFGLSFNPDEVAGNVEDAAKAYKEARDAG